MGEETLNQAVKGCSFDYVIASHVIEHVPDMIGWMKEVSEVLKDDGILSLAIPDKRYSFDFQREISTPGMFIEAYLRKNRKPTPQAIFDYFGLTAKVDVESAWKDQLTRTSLQPQGKLTEVFNWLKKFIQKMNTKTYMFGFLPLVVFLIY